ncbi:uncharacterized protein LOC114942624 [Nylanderia fulva]|uniref:uncharacterized protein LOC114942624 n=1 Tax=Nylanderia fulva TaxID=613905 RepID=UPI0010FB2BF5|nr:uncharacterized protein LOC114942624 [Nylanderia fulva]
MKRTHVTLMIGIMILVIAIEVLIIYSIMIYSATAQISLSSTASFENLTAKSSSTVSTLLSETTTVDKITIPATQSKIPKIPNKTTYFKMLSIPSRALLTQSTTQKYITNTQLSSEMVSSDAKEVTMNTIETTPIMVTTIIPTITLTNGESEISADIASIITSKMTSTITVETGRTTITTVKDTITNTSAIETTSMKKSSTTTSMPNPKCTKTNATICCTESIALEFDYIVRDIETGRACVLTNMMIRINLRYAMKDSQIGNAMLTVPTNAKITGICHEKIAKMTLSWKEPVETQLDSDNKENRIIFHYAHNETNFFLDFISIDVHLDGNNFPRAQKKRMHGDTSDRHLQLFSASIKYEIFICEVNTIINIGDEIDVIISDIRLIAFNECIQNCSKTEIDCVADCETRANSNVIVGSVLGILMLILIFRKWRRRISKKKDSEKLQHTANKFLSCEKIVIKKWNFSKENK